MGYDKPVRDAVNAAQELAGMLENDFDVEHGGFSWWHDYGLSANAEIGIMDYLHGLVGGIRENLQSAAIDLLDLREKRYAEDITLRQKLSSNKGHVNLLNSDEHSAKLRASITARTVSVLRAAGSALDNLGGVVIGVGGLASNLIKSDLGKLQLFEYSDSYPSSELLNKLGISNTPPESQERQIGLLRATRSSLLCAGPQDWLSWTLRTRNDRVHRATRLEIAYPYDADKIARPFPSQPDFASVQSFSEANSVEQLILTEDSVKTLEGVVSSLNAAVVGVMTACAELWKYRRAHPDVIRQPNEQWPEKPRRSTNFDGYSPGTSCPPKGRNTGISLNPTDIMRLRAAKIILS